MAFAHLAVCRTRCAVAVIVLVGLVVGVTPAVGADAKTHSLPLGDHDLAETRQVETLTAGVTLTRIVRGTEPADVDTIQTTTRGPWRVNVLSIDRRKARGRLEAAFGSDLSLAEKTTELVVEAGALAGVNASFFTFTSNRKYPGEPVGLGVYEGELQSEPTEDGSEVDFLVDAETNEVMLGHFKWSGRMRNSSTRASIRLESLNHPPMVPADCRHMTDQTHCDERGDVVLFTHEFGRSTPAGLGVEVVLGGNGCVDRSSGARGTVLAENQVSVQATGRQTRTLLRLTRHGCLDRSVDLIDGNGEALPLNDDMFGVNGRYRLTADGDVVAPDGRGPFFSRNPRTVAGTTAEGTIRLVTIDGRQITSVGTTVRETAAVALSLGLNDSVNLDGGGSTTMAVGDQLVNQPSAGSERAVGDALVYVDRPSDTSLPLLRR